ncbi:zinc metalloproteinase nas-1-like [Vanessa cardui]|uniref:zinc metalloproteinase nas-1-like n=1 Tax=Vanessa cardui TaxID=171605 RepID=UPI001F12B763|nr:zinc metalloproteinase nas-1-like [Vanessa cardui]
MQKTDYSNESGFDLNDEDMHKFHVWPSGIIPYLIDDFSFDKVLKDMIRLYLSNINIVTGLSFTEILQPPEDDTSRWVLFINRIGQLGCVDLPFRNFSIEGVQKVVLGYDCLAAGKISAVILSLIGVPPQHNEPDRDTKITVIPENVLPDKLYFFDKLKDDEWLFYELEYDFNSAGHYNSHQYTSNGGETIVIPNTGKDWLHEKGIGLSVTDVKKIKMLYNYIIRKDTPKKLKGCEKLFAPGINFDKYRKNDSLEVEPRKKPNRYLLLSDEKPPPDISPKNKVVNFLSHKLSNKQQILNESDYETDYDSNET